MKNKNFWAILIGAAITIIACKAPNSNSAGIDPSDPGNPGNPENPTDPTLTGPIDGLDGNFNDYLADQGYDTDGDGAISYEEAELIEAIDNSINGGGFGIASVEGIEYFPNLKTLVLKYTKLNDVDLTKASQLLETVNFSSSSLNSLKFGNKPNLTRVSLANLGNTSALDSIDLSQAPNLEELILQGSPSLKGLNISNVGALKKLDIHNNAELVALDVSSNFNLTEMDALNVKNLVLTVSKEQKAAYSNNQLTNWRLETTANLVEKN